MQRTRRTCFERNDAVVPRGIARFDQISVVNMTNRVSKKNMRHEHETADIPRQVGLVKTAAGAHDDDIEYGHEMRVD